MWITRAKSVFIGTIVTLAGIGVAGSARAAVYEGNWDPTYGNIFPNLGWKATGLFNVPDACLAQGDGSYTETGACANFAVLSTSVSFYNITTPGALLGTYSLDTSVTINGITIANHALTGIGSGFFDYFVPNGAAASIAGGGQYAFSLIFLGNNQAQLIYESPIPSSPGCAFFPVANTSCGVSQSAAIATFTTVVPEPETYALILAGLGVLGVVARRRKLRQ